MTEVMPGSKRFGVLLDLAESVLAQARYTEVSVKQGRLNGMHGKRRAFRGVDACQSCHARMGGRPD